MPIDYHPGLKGEHVVMEASSIHHNVLTKIAVLDVDGCLFNALFYEKVASGLLETMKRHFEKSSRFSGALLMKSSVESALVRANSVLFDYFKTQNYTEFLNGSVRQSVTLDDFNASKSRKICIRKAKVMLEESVWSDWIEPMTKGLNDLDSDQYNFFFTSTYIFEFMARQLNMTYLKFLSPDVYAGCAVGGTHEALRRALHKGLKHHSREVYPYAMIYADFLQDVSKNRKNFIQMMCPFDDGKLLDCIAKLHILSKTPIELTIFDDRHDILQGLSDYLSTHPSMVPTHIQELKLMIYATEQSRKGLVKIIFRELASMKGAGERKDVYPLIKNIAKVALEAAFSRYPRIFCEPDTRQTYRFMEDFQAAGFKAVIIEPNKELQDKRFNALEYMDVVHETLDVEQYNLTQPTVMSFVDGADSSVMAGASVVQERSSETPNSRYISTTFFATEAKAETQRPPSSAQYSTTVALLPGLPGAL